MVEVIIVDDHALIRKGLRALLIGYKDVEVVGEAQDGAQAVLLVGQLRPHVVVMDVNMPTMNGIEATKHIKSRWPETTVIGLSVNVHDDNETAMKRAGATGLLAKESAAEHLYEAIQEAVRK